MKKLLSVSLALLIAAASLVINPLMGSIAAADANSTVTFDENYYTSTDGIHGAELDKTTFAGTEHGNAARYNKISKWTSQNAGKWPNAVRIASDSGNSAFGFERNTRYKISMDIKKVTASNAFNIYLFALAENNGLAGITINNKNFYYEWIGGGAADWTTITKTVDTNFFDTDVSTLAIALYRSNPGYDNQEIYIDNIRVEKVGKLATVTAHNNNGTADTVTTYLETDNFNVIPAPEYPGKTFDGWYTDEALTQRAIGAIGSGEVHIYAKWLDYVTADKTLIDFEMPGTIEQNQDGQLTYRGSATEDPKVIATGSGTKITETDGADGNKTNAINFLEANVSKNRWPVMLWLYDSKQEQLGALNYAYKPRANSVYKISLKYRVDKKSNYKLYLQLRNFDNLTNPGYNEDDIYLKEFVEISDKTDGWLTAEAYFFTGNAPSNTGLALVSSTVGTKPKDVDVWVDDIEIEEMLGSQKVVFETNGGTALTETHLFSENLGSYEIPQKDGYVFAGWYTDSALTEAFDITNAPEGDIRLYAKWEPKAENAAEYKTGFEVSEFENGKSPYKNGGTDNSSDKSVSWITDDSDNAYSGSGRLELVNNGGVYTETSKRWLAAAVMNKDGSYYQVVKGARYKFAFNYFVNNPENASVRGQTIVLGTSASVPSFTLNANNLSAIHTVVNSGAMEKDNGFWYYCEGTFEADKTEKLYIAAYTTNAAQVVGIDELSITPMSNSEIVKISYYADKETETPVYSTVGIPGEEFSGVPAQAADGKLFAGWVDESGKQYIDCVLPKKDTKLYATWKDKTETEPKYLAEANCDFEDQSGAKAFYGDANNIYSDGQIELKTNMTAKAHGGKGYLSFTNAGHWIKSYYRTVNFYNSETPDNKIWLEPGGIYKIGYWIKIDKCTGGSNLYLAGFNKGYADEDGIAPYTILSENYMDAASAFSENGEWVYKEYFVLNDELPAELGFVLYGGYLSASIDDISVIKLKNVTVTFDSNGGTEMNPVSTLTYNTVMNPGDSEKNGYYFDGWYWDKALTKKFNFVTDYVTENTTLYAKWLPWQYKTEITGYEEEEKTITTPPPAPEEQDNAITFTENDKVGKIEKVSSGKSTEDTSMPAWLIALIIAGSAAVVIAAGITVVLIVRKKKSKGGNA